MGKYCWVTLATNDSYSLGALVLAHSLKQAGTQQELAVLVTPGVTNAMREKLATVFNVVQEVNILDSKDEANLKLLKRPELGITFTKLHCWRLTQYEKCVFLDADTLVLENCDELFDREELSAAPDVGWPDCFNTGVFVYRPSNDTYNKLVQFALDKGSFDGGDQGLLNLYFSDWAHKDISKHLPFIYNVCSTACYSYLPAFKQFGGNAKIIHFIGATKPWLQYFDTLSGKVNPSGDSQHLQNVLQRWWDIFCSLIHPQLSSQMTRSSSANVMYGNPIPNKAPDTHFSQTHHSRSLPIPHHDQFDAYVPVIEKQTVWDPWEEYHEKQSQSQIDSLDNEPIQSHNTNACNDHLLITEDHSQIDSSEPPPQPLVPVPDFSSPPPSPSNNRSPSPIPISPPTPPESPLLQPDPTVESVISFQALPKSETAPSAITQNSTELSDSAGLAGALSQLTLGAPRSAEQSALEDHLRRQGWEVGNIDYLGRDSFDNIWSKICSTISATPAPEPAVEQKPKGLKQQ